MKTSLKKRFNNFVKKMVIVVRNFFAKLWKNIICAFDRSIANRLWRQLVFYCLILVMLTAIVYFCSQSQSLKQVIVNMLSPVPLYNNVYESPTPGENVGLLFFTYFIGLVVFSGLFIATITNMIKTRADHYKSGDVHYPLNDHILILGYSKMVAGLIKQICQQKEERKCDIVLAIENDVHRIRETLLAQIGSKNGYNIILLHANRDNEKDLKQLRVHRARRIYIIGNEDDSTHDSINLSCFMKICKLCQNNSQQPHCYTNLKYQSTFALFQTYATGNNENVENCRISPVSQENMSIFNAKKRYFHPFNVHEMWARKIWSGNDPDYQNFALDYRNEENNIMAHPEKRVYLVIIGMTELGNIMAREAAFIAHYPNFITQSNHPKTRITFIDENAHHEMEFLAGRYRELFEHCHSSFQKLNWNCEGESVLKTPAPEKDFLDIEFEFIEANIANPILMNKMEQWSQDPLQILTIVACLTESYKNIAAAFYLPFKVYEQQIPILVYQESHGNIDKFLSCSKYKNVKPFGMTDEPLQFETIELDWAKKINYFYRHLNDNDIDFSHTVDINKAWDACIVSNKWSSLYNAAAIATKIRCMRQIHGGDVNAALQDDEVVKVFAEVEHNRWNIEKLLMGFRPVTPEEKAIIDNEPSKKKLYKNRFVHHDIRTYNELDESIKEIDIKLTRVIGKIIKS